MTKYHAKRTEVAGKVFASQREARRFIELRLLERSGKIRNLETQPKFDITINGVKVCSYFADFRYFEGNRCVVEDSKGMRTPLYRLKKRLVEAAYPGTIIQEV